MKDQKRILWTIICQKIENLEEIDKFLETFNLSRLNYEQIETLNRPIMMKVIESVSKNLPTKKRSWSDGFTGEFKETVKEYQCNANSSHRMEENRYFQSQHSPIETKTLQDKEIIDQCPWWT